MSSFLVPQEPLQSDSIRERLTSLRLYKTQQTRFESEIQHFLVINNKVEPENDDTAANGEDDGLKIDSLIRDIENTKEIYSPYSLPAKLKYDGYQWSQESDCVSISVKPVSSVELMNRINSIEIIDDTISSEFVAGKLYQRPKSFDIQNDGQKVTILLYTDKAWPILIRGDADRAKMDNDSLFLLSVIAMKFKRNEMAQNLLLRAAMKSHVLSMKHVAYRFQKESDEEASFYWFVRIFLETNEILSFSALFNKLVNNNFEINSSNIINKRAIINDEVGQNDELGLNNKELNNGVINNASDNNNDDGAFERAENAKLFENILVDQANKKVPNSFLFLGYLHMTDIFGFAADISLAVKYFEVAANDYHNKKAMDTLGRCLMSGVGTEKDLEKSIKLLHSSGMKTDGIKKLVKEEKERTNKLKLEKQKEKKQKEKKQQIKSTLIKVSCAALAVGGTLFVGFCILRRRRGNK